MSFSPMVDFEGAFRRVYEVLEANTQSDVATFLNIRQSSIADAKRRKNIPDNWLVSLLRLKNISPEWILTGTGNKYVIFSDEQPHREPIVKIRPPQECTTEVLLAELICRGWAVLENDQKS